MRLADSLLAAAVAAAGAAANLPAAAAAGPAPQSLFSAARPAAPYAAQRPARFPAPPIPAALRASAAPFRTPPSVHPPSTAQDRPRLGEGEAFASSLLAPGLAQYRQGQRRWAVYAGMELLAAALLAHSGSDARRLRTDYRDLAWTAARAGLSAGPRRDGDFEYYERLAHWAASGAWDADPARDGVQPESDPATYNGSVWALAVQIYDLDPEVPGRSPRYGQAVGYYREMAYGPRYLWAWRGGGGDQRRFGGLIADSDSRFKDARRALWMLAANHLLSSVDGFITARLRALPRADAVELALSAPVP